MSKNYADIVMNTFQIQLHIDLNFNLIKIENCTLF